MMKIPETFGVPSVQQAQRICFRATPLALASRAEPSRQQAQCFLSGNRPALFACMADVETILLGPVFAKSTAGAFRLAVGAGRHILHRSVCKRRPTRLRGGTSWAASVTALSARGPPKRGPPAPLGPWPEPGFSLTSLLPRRLPRSFQARSAAAQSRATRHLISEVPAQGSDRKVLLSWQRICAEELATLPSSSSRNIRSREQEGAWHSTKVPLCCMAPCLSVLLHNHIPKEGNRCSYSYWCRLVSLALAPEAQLDLLSFTNLVQSS